ncbi:hypothetical protein P872_23380 [Rhodonellum psychrophilum GCM71 = DSM 17998]|uniref:Uncharacterized protein n=2 Tax=Rhodonellum TaxID=336827 RepID=U5C5C4_9BACT|nr:hypothetical protein P872_23380 [Rhodonellum psychrophilum GCM71 = DSM 17998]SDY76051.1 hypothetical protein SAMN05444412_102499 [Rhodonellum ikkaensis]
MVSEDISPESECKYREIILTYKTLFEISFQKCFASFSIFEFQCVLENLLSNSPHLGLQT